MFKLSEVLGFSRSTLCQPNCVCFTVFFVYLESFVAFTLSLPPPFYIFSPHPLAISPLPSLFSSPYQLQIHTHTLPKTESTVHFHPSLAAELIRETPECGCSLILGSLTLAHLSLFHFKIASLRVPVGLPTSCISVWEAVPCNVLCTLESLSKPCIHCQCVKCVCLCVQGPIMAKETFLRSTFSIPHTSEAPSSCLHCLYIQCWSTETIQRPS